MKRNWHYEDIVDLEYFTQLDRNTSPAEVQQRDRQICLETISTNSTPENESPQQLLAVWLKNRRSSSAAAPSPGQIFSSALRSLQLLLLFSGAILGVSTGLAFFSYSGATPVNVLHFLLLFIAPQLALMCILLTGIFLRLPKSNKPPSIIGQLILSWLQTISTYTANKIAQQFPAEEKLQITAFLGQAKGMYRQHSRLFSWLILRLTQVFSIAFNLAVLGISLGKIAATDIAFGWQSTLQFSAEALYRLIAMVSLPWSWFFPVGSGYPTLTQIEGSRIILKDGHHFLATADLISWWPFLVLSLCCYVLIPRCLILFFCLLREKTLKTQTLESSQLVSQLQRRMLTPHLSSQAEPFSPNPSETPEPQDLRAPFFSASSVKSPLLVLYPDELSGKIQKDELAKIFVKEGFALLESLPLTLALADKAELLDTISRFTQTQPCTISILAESWMPPILSFLLFVQEVRKCVGSSTMIEIRLLGKPSGEHLITTVTDSTMMAVWQQKIDTLADPHLHISPLIYG